MTKQTDDRLAEQIRALFDQHGIMVAVDVRDAVVQLLGPVDSPRLRLAAIDLAASVAGVRGIDDQMEYEVISPDAITEPPDVDGEFAFADAGAFDDNIPDHEPDFAAEVVSDNFQEVVEEGGTYFPPTDPVVRPSDDPQELEIVGGMQATSMDEPPPTRDDLLAQIGDQPDTGEILINRDDADIRDDVVRELGEDALTTDLDLMVNVVNGIVFLHGQVQSLDDAENAEAVSSRVTGVIEVRDMTEIVQ